MNDLETLRPEVQKALDDLSYFLTGTHNHDDFYAIRAELLRLADSNATLDRALSKHVFRCTELQLRAEKAESELAALKARIADAPVATLVYGQSDMLSVLSAENADDWAGKTVRLLVDDSAPERVEE